LLSSTTSIFSALISFLTMEEAQPPPRFSCLSGPNSAEVRSKTPATPALSSLVATALRRLRVTSGSPSQTQSKALKERVHYGGEPARRHSVGRTFGGAQEGLWKTVSQAGRPVRCPRFNLLSSAQSPKAGHQTCFPDALVRFRGVKKVRPVSLAGTFVDWSGCNLLGGPGDSPGTIPAIPPGNDQEPAG